MFAERTYPVKDPRRFVSEAGWRPQVGWARRVQKAADSLGPKGPDVIVTPQENTDDHDSLSRTQRSTTLRTNASNVLSVGRSVVLSVVTIHQHVARCGHGSSNCGGVRGIGW
jgi:hypothetical protein